MPYKSQAQAQFFHSAGASKAGITPEQVTEFDESTHDEGQLPARAAKKPLPDHLKKRIAVRRALKGGK
jgi:hypothetical protein